MQGRRDIGRLQEQLEELFDDLWQVPRFSGARRGFRPAVDVYRTEDPEELTIVVELPGVDPDRIGIALEGRNLYVAGERRPSRNPGKASYYQLEMEYGTFQRRVALPHEVDGAKARATYDRGLLTIVLPLATKPPRGAKVAISISTRA